MKVNKLILIAVTVFLPLLLAFIISWAYLKGMHLKEPNIAFTADSVLESLVTYFGVIVTSFIAWLAIRQTKNTEDQNKKYRLLEERINKIINAQNIPFLEVMVSSKVKMKSIEDIDKIKQRINSDKGAIVINNFDFWCDQNMGRSCFVFIDSVEKLKSLVELEFKYFGASKAYSIYLEKIIIDESEKDFKSEKILSCIKEDDIIKMTLALEKDIQNSYDIQKIDVLIKAFDPIARAKANKEEKENILSFMLKISISLGRAVDQNGNKLDFAYIYDVDYNYLNE